MASVGTLIREAQEAGTLKQERFTPAQWSYIRAVSSDADAITDLSKFAIACLPTGVYQFRGVRTIVRYLLGAKINRISIRTDLNCDDDNYYECKRIITDFIHNLRDEVVLVLDAQNKDGTSEAHDQLTVAMQ